MPVIASAAKQSIIASEAKRSVIASSEATRHCERSEAISIYSLFIIDLDCNLVPIII